MSGVTRQSYTTDVKIIRLMCTGRVDLAFVLRAFAKGADGVIIGGCWPGECHYVTEGNYDALGNMYLVKMLLQHSGMAPDRLRLEWIAASEGMRFAEVMNDFGARLRELGPLGEGEGLSPLELKSKLSAIDKIIPYLKLVERERLRISEKTEEAYRQYYESVEIKNLFKEMVADKLTVGQILGLLQEKPASTAEISETLGLNPSEVAKHMNRSSRQGLVKFDMEQKCFTLA